MKQIKGVTQAIEEATKYVADGDLLCPYNTLAMFETMINRPYVMADLVAEIEWFLQVGFLDNFHVLPTETPASLEKLLVEKFGKEQQ